MWRTDTIIMARNSGNAPQSFGAVAPSGGAGVRQKFLGALTLIFGHHLGGANALRRETEPSEGAPEGVDAANHFPRQQHCW